MSVQEAHTGSGPGSGSVGSGKPKTSRRWLQPRVKKEELYRLAPRPPAPERLGRRHRWHWARRMIRNWVLWTATSFALSEFGHPYLALVVAFVAVFLYLASPQFHPAAYPIDPDFAPGSPEFLTTMSGITAAPYIPGNSVQILNDGDEFYPAMLKDIESATESITMEQYIFWEGKVGVRFAEAFAQRARAGVKVKLLVDAIGSATLGEENIRILEAGGAQLGWYHPIRWYTLDRANSRTHRKSLIIDGKVAYTGGAGIGDQWLGRSRDPSEWRDMMIRVEGPAAAVQQAGFAQSWLLTTGEILTGSKYFPEPQEVDDICVQTILSSPSEGAGSTATMYMLALESARKCLWIANPYFIPSGAFIDLLDRACKRGVEIKLMVAGKHNDTWWARENSVRLYGSLLDAGVEVYEFEPAMLHHKTMIVDGLWATIGTTNFDNRSFALSNETNVCLMDRAVVHHLERIFQDDLTRCKQIDRAIWRKRKLRFKLQEMAASLIEDQV